MSWSHRPFEDDDEEEKDWKSFGEGIGQIVSDTINRKTAALQSRLEKAEKVVEAAVPFAAVEGKEPPCFNLGDCLNIGAAIADYNKEKE